MNNKYASLNQAVLEYLSGGMSTTALEFAQDAIEEGNIWFSMDTGYWHGYHGTFPTIARLGYRVGGNHGVLRKV